MFNNKINTLNQCHSSLKFTMGIEQDGSLPIVGVELLNRAPKIESKVNIKPTNTGILLHHQSHVDIRHKRSPFNSMLDRAYRLPPDWSLFHEECDRLREVFWKYPPNLINTAIKKLLNKANTIRITLLFKDRSSADVVKEQLDSLSLKVSTTIQHQWTRTVRSNGFAPK